MLDIPIEVANSLHWDLAVPRYRVRASVDGGQVTLRGNVDWLYQKECAEADVRRVPGVTRVTNEIVVIHQEAKSETLH